MDESILNSTKRVLGIASDYTVFDTDIVMHINLAFSILTDLGVGPSGGFVIENATTEWTDYVVSTVQLSMVRTYIFLKVEMLFDPPASQFAADAKNKQIAEYEWRMNIRREVETHP